MGSNIFDANVVLSNFDGGYNVCDEEFVHVIVLGGGVSYVLVRDICYLGCL